MRISSRCASSSLPCSRKYASRSSSSSSIAIDRAAQLLVRRDEVLGREDQEFVFALDVLAGQHVDDVDRLDLVAEKLDAMHELLVDADELERVAAHAEGAAHEVDVVAPVLHVDELAQQRVAVDLSPTRTRTDISM